MRSTCVREQNWVTGVVENSISIHDSMKRDAALLVQSSAST